MDEKVLMSVVRQEMPSMSDLLETNPLGPVEAPVSTTLLKMEHLQRHSRKHNTSREKGTREHMLSS